MPRLRDTPGTALRLLVVSTGPAHCAGIDLDSGTLVRAWSPLPVDPHLSPYDVVSVTIAADSDLVPDPAEPEAVALTGPPQGQGRLTGRAAKRLINPLLHPPGSPLLGSHGPTVPFWERRSDHPSVAITQPKGTIVVTAEQGELWCHFEWKARPMVLACQDPRLQASLANHRRTAARMRPGTLLVVALSPPVDGHCHKVVESLVPRR
jgi:hypothetical protein